MIVSYRVIYWARDGFSYIRIQIVKSFGSPISWQLRFSTFVPDQLESDAKTLKKSNLCLLDSVANIGLI